MDDVDIGLFDRDWNNAVYYFFLNADEKIYMRYGGRDSKSPDTYLNLDSFEIAARKALELHRRYESGDQTLPERPPAFLPRQIPLLVQRTFDRGRCVECHLIGDFQNIQRQKTGVLDKVTDLYRSPDIRSLGIELEVPKGLVVAYVDGAAAAAGINAGDRISALNGSAVWTFGDLQYSYDKVKRDAKEVRIAVDRKGRARELTVKLPPRWWWTDLRFRMSSVDPQVDFEDRPLTEDEKSKRGLKAEGFASQVSRVAERAPVRKTHALRAGDIICDVDGMEQDDLATTASLFVKLHRTAGQSVMLNVIRDGEHIKMPLRTYAVNFRK